MTRLVEVLFVVMATTLIWSSAEAQNGVQGYRVKPGDSLLVSVWGEPDLQRSVLVTPDGGFSFPLVGRVDARNKTTSDLEQALVQGLGPYISSPVVTVGVEEVNGNKVYVLGQVNQPGVFVMNPDINVMQALSMARGTTPFAQLDNIVVLRHGPSGQVALPFPYAAVVRGRSLDANITLESGDVVVVP